MKYLIPLIALSFISCEPDRKIGKENAEVFDFETKGPTFRIYRINIPDSGTVCYLDSYPYKGISCLNEIRQ